MIKLTKILSLFAILILLTSCASGYKKVNPTSLNYISKSFTNDVVLEYKYDLLENKYKKKEEKSKIKMVAVKITSNSDKDLVFGNNLQLVYENGNSVLLLENEKVYTTVKQSPASYLWYLLLSPIQFYTYSTNQYGQTKVDNSFPIGLIVGPGLSGGNMIAASSANSNLLKELRDYNIIGKTIKKGETVYGLIGIQSDSYESLKLKID